MSDSLRRYRPRLRRPAALYLSAALLMSGTAGCYTFGGKDLTDLGREESSSLGAAGTEPDADLSRAMDLPWPTEGQASAEVEGVGSLGTQGEQTPVPIASITKVMTAYVILTDHPMPAGEQGETVTADQRAADESYSSSESTAPLVADREYTQRQLLELMMLPSGNNVARLLARWDAGSQEEFAKKMNKAASKLGMDRTVYTGASGIEPSTQSTATDQLKLARAVMKNEAFRQIVATPTVTVPGVGVQIDNSNRLLGRDGVIGLKTGSSTPAGGNLMWAATKEIEGTSHLILGVVLHQQAGTSPTQAMAAAFNASHTLITAIRSALPQALAGR
ncbi:D-alanyl-D-alanine carboxypeptidase family protein [Streptomyces sp. WAC01280]|uniref:D-alanyl-D-alanine carboxypeptidase family protein n=1 Tax=Streptomyces sp. WAC01280 TaxID=2487424 RepID=UPI000F7AF12A|nr:serine hydrolase [Streptomyces sp. WAC01280]RSS59148.1 D-alanyl-D-alanine carboxypeptidase [Streptomyces sp. WAC01280]